MALRAGYYGIKRAFRDKLEQIIPAGASKSNKLATENEIMDIWNLNAKNGVHNILKATLPSPATVSGITLSESDGVFSCSSDTATATAIFIIASDYLIPKGTYFLTGCPAGGSTGTDKYRVDMYVDATTVFAIDGGEGTIFTLNQDTTMFYIRIRIAKDIDATGLVFKPMIVPIKDKSTIFAPFANTNYELTKEVATINSTLEDHKTDINAIISAATGAADFAAFKASMEALTPLTRSLSTPDTRSTEPLETIPEETEIEEQPVKKTTRKKSTAKADTKEEV